MDEDPVFGEQLWRNEPNVVKLTTGRHELAINPIWLASRVAEWLANLSHHRELIHRVVVKARNLDGRCVMGGRRSNAYDGE